MKRDVIGCAIGIVAPTLFLMIIIFVYSWR